MKSIFNGKLFAAALMAMSLGLVGCLTDSKDDKKEEEPEITTPWTSDSVLTVGAQANSTLGTAIDLDGRRVMLSAEVNDTTGNRANMRSVDLLFVFHESSFKIMSAASAKAAGISVAANYVDSILADVKFVKVETAPANVEAAVVAYLAGEELTSSVVAAGDMFVVLTSEGEHAFVTVSSLDGDSSSGSGTLTVNIRLVEAGDE